MAVPLLVLVGARSSLCSHERHPLAPVGSRKRVAAHICFFISWHFASLRATIITPIRPAGALLSRMFSSVSFGMDASQLAVDRTNVPLNDGVIMIVASALAVSFAASPGPDPCCCFKYRDRLCCAQIAEQFTIVCNGSACVGTWTSSGNYRGSELVLVSEQGYPNQQWVTLPNGTTCTWREPYCLDNVCYLDPIPQVWECHNEILSGSCTG